jgi:phosphate acetyltransferase
MMMVYKGDVDGMVSGEVHYATYDQAKTPVCKNKTGIRCFIHFFMCLPDRVCVFGDWLSIPI